MRGNLGTAEERLNYLNTSLHLHTLSIRAHHEDQERINRTRSPAVVSKPTRSTPEVTKPTRSTPVVSKPTSIILPRSNSSSNPGDWIPRNNRATELRMKSINSSSTVNKPRRAKSNGRILLLISIRIICTQYT